MNLISFSHYDFFQQEMYKYLSVIHIYALKKAYPSVAFAPEDHLWLVLQRKLESLGIAKDLCKPLLDIVFKTGHVLSGSFLLQALVYPLTEIADVDWNNDLDIYSYSNTSLEDYFLFTQELEQFFVVDMEKNSDYDFAALKSRRFTVRKGHHVIELDKVSITESLPFRAFFDYHFDFAFLKNWFDGNKLHILYPTSVMYKRSDVRFYDDYSKDDVIPSYLEAIGLKKWLCNANSVTRQKHPVRVIRAKEAIAHARIFKYCNRGFQINLLPPSLSTVKRKRE
jgi:hypothetical protein